jgi:hypothetical protein
MAQKFMKTQEVADFLGLTPADVNNLRETHQLHAYRDGADWKFKAEEVEQYARDRQSGKSAPEEEEDADVVLSEFELGEPGPSASGTVIGPPDPSTAPSESDIRLAGSDLNLAGSDLNAVGSDIMLSGSGPLGSGKGKDSGLGELDLTLDDDLTFEDSQLRLDEAGPNKGAGDGSGVTDDGDDLVLGGSGGGSDITIGGDSGISLVDPADSGLSLEDPLDVGSSEESLELGEDDMLTFSEAADTEAPTELKADDDFLLTPLDEGSEEDSESGSQVIALDGDMAPDDAATMIAHAPGAGMAAMLDEDFSAAGAGPMGPMPGALDAAPLGPAAPVVAAPGYDPNAFAAQALPETPYTILQVLSLAGCLLFLMLGGMMAYDLLRNMWSWNGPYTVNSSLMDWILSLVG